jgi:hypothetical protein
VTEARAAEHHHRVVDALGLLRQVGLEHLQLEADAAGLAPQQELGVGKGQPVGIGMQEFAAVGMRLQFGPGVGEAAVLEVLGAFHGWNCARKTGYSCGDKRSSTAMRDDKPFLYASRRCWRTSMSSSATTACR